MYDVAEIFLVCDQDEVQQRAVYEALFSFSVKSNCRLRLFASELVHLDGLVTHVLKESGCSHPS